MHQYVSKVLWNHQIGPQKHSRDSEFSLKETQISNGLMIWLWIPTVSQLTKGLTKQEELNVCWDADRIVCSLFFYCSHCSSVFSSATLFLGGRLLNFSSLKFRYSEKDIKISPVFRSVKLHVDDGTNFCGLLRIFELY